MDNNIDENTIVEINTSVLSTDFEDASSVEDDKLVIKNKKKRNSKFSKKKLIIIFSILGGVLIIAAILYILYIKGVFKKAEPETPKEPDVIVEKDNFIYKNGTLELLNNAAKTIGVYECKNKEVEKCYVAYLTNEDEFDVPVYAFENSKEEFKRSTKIYEDKFVLVNDGNDIILFDIENKNVLGTYKAVKNGNIKNDYIVIKDENDKYGIIQINSTGVSSILDIDYDYLGIIDNEEVFVARSNDKDYLINKLGKAISSKVNGRIKKFSDKYIVAGDAEGYSLYNYQGILVLNGEYEYIDLQDGYVFTIKNKKMTVLNNDLVKLNEEPIKLINSNYNKTYIFDNELNIKESLKSYEVTCKTDSININVVDGAEVSINLYETNLNKEYDYVNYINGYLYIYLDADKTNLLGKYKCNTVNSVGKDTQAYANCFIGKDSSIINEKSNGYIPIVNNNYAFIYDNNIIELYDLKNNKSLAKYSSVDSGISMDHIAHITSKDALIFAQNTEGYYGAINFSNGPKSIIQFKYCIDKENDKCTEYEYTKSISMLGDYYLVKRTKENYLYDKNGTILGHSKFNIISYDNPYMVVKDSGYIIYNNGKIASDSMDYVKLEKNYYVGIKNNKLNIYSYDKTPLLENSLDMQIGSYANGYSIDVKNDGYTINIITKENTKEPHDYNLDWSIVVPETPEEPETPEKELEEEK